MTALTYIAPTKRSHMSKARAAKIFLANNGRCCVCGNQIRPGEAYEIEHPDALSLGGSDRDEDLRPVHVKCHKIKTASDAKARAKRNRIVTQGYVGNKSKRGFSSRFKKRLDGTIIDKTTGEAFGRRG